MSSEKSGYKFNGECVHKKKMYKSVIRFEDGSQKEEMILEPNMLYALAKHVLAYSDFPLIESVRVELRQWRMEEKMRAAVEEILAEREKGASSDE